MDIPLSRLRALLWSTLIAASYAAGVAAQVTKVPVLSPQVGSGVGSAGGSLGSGSGISGDASLNLSAPALDGSYLPSANGISPVTGGNGNVLPAVMKTPAGAVSPGVSVRTPAKVPAAKADAMAARKEEGSRIPLPNVDAEEIEIQYYNPSTGRYEDLAGAGGQEEGLRQGVSEPDPGSGAVMFDGAQGRQSSVDIAQDRSRGPPASAASSDPLGLFELLKQKDTPAFQAGLSKSPEAFKKVATAVLNRLKAWKKSPASAHAITKGGASVAGLRKAQTDFKETLLAAAERFTQERGIDSREVITNGTSLQPLMGILFSGSIYATNPHKGFSGETAEVWGAYGLEGGASYGAKRGVARNEPGVMILIKNEGDPIRIIEGETMSRSPRSKDDFLAVIISDGSRTVVLDKPLLAALSSSSELWKESVVAKAHKGQMQPFYEWERYRERFEPK